MSLRPLSADAQMRQSLQLLRESLQRPANLAHNPATKPANPATLLTEDVQNLDNAATQELQQAMGAAIGAALVVSSVQEAAGVTTVKGLLRLGQDLHFTFTSQQPDGCFVTAQNLELSESTAQILGKLQAYHATWYAQTASGDAAPGAAPAPLPGDAPGGDPGAPLQTTPPQGNNPEQPA